MSRPLEAFTFPHRPVIDPLEHGTTPRASLATAIRRAVAALGWRRRTDGHWVFPLEADATIPADYVLLQHYLDRIDEPLQARIGTYLRRIQADEGGWPMHPGGRFDLSVSVKAYFALNGAG
ncbi:MULTISPECIES: prenyltransferase/squalene oxidase repeat-containing protein [Methylobacterium]|uniref:Squalene cyclase N-terminal domain-containing protein n=1 Tax=Methylobacterium thuringiense TaxID=1003091 RepID=A0ABQ4TK00_9HYPH|nr:prenyltransferase/squalene oxidase repeat-containing protein [Methylobacterium thuringiense]TXN22974.1 hypothetical protein FV217_08575 [Methylobacterium sp. WL9]GJE55618.1 hypothetical protein EKPJFOCH_2113 [Methylobacterium thuringiense]